MNRKYIVIMLLLASLGSTIHAMGDKKKPAGIFKFRREKDEKNFEKFTKFLLGSSELGLAIFSSIVPIFFNERDCPLLRKAVLDFAKKNDAALFNLALFIYRTDFREDLRDKKNGKNPLVYAIENNNKKMINSFLKNWKLNAHIFRELAKNDTTDDNSLHLIFTAMAKSKIEDPKFLQEIFNEIRSRYVLFSDQFDTQLLEKNKAGKTPLDIIYENGNLLKSILDKANELLQDKRESIEHAIKHNKGQFAAELLVKKGETMAKELIENDENDQIFWEKFLLHCAEKKAIDIFEKILESLEQTYAKQIKTLELSNEKTVEQTKELESLKKNSERIKNLTKQFNHYFPGYATATSYFFKNMNPSIERNIKKENLEVPFKKDHHDFKIYFK